MKNVMKWAAIAAGVAAGGYYAYRWFSAARAGVDRSLEQAENITASTRQALESTQEAIHQTRRVI